MAIDFGKKKGMSPIEKKAKLAALGGAHKMASDALKGNLDKVSVLSNSKSGLQHGLKKAEELVSGSKMFEDGDDADGRVHSGKERKHYMGDEAQDLESSDFTEEGEESCEEDSLSEDELDAKIEELMALKEKKSSKG